MEPERDVLAKTSIQPDAGAKQRSHSDGQGDDIFFAAFGTTRMPMILTDPRQPDNPIVFANRAFLQLVGYDEEQIVGHNCRFLQGPETDRNTVKQIREAIGRRAEVAVEILNYKRDGTSFWNGLFISPVFSKAGELLYFFASQLDVSRRRDAEAALRQSQKMEAVGQLTGGIAHDFNNLLQIIIGYMESLTNQATTLGNARMMRQTAAVSEAASRAATLTQQLLAFSRKQKLESRVLNLNQLVRGMSELADRTLGDAIEIDFRLRDQLWNARIDPSQAEMALLNIMINARDAMPGGGAITVETDNVQVQRGDEVAFNGLPAGRYAMIAITDTGTGMAPAIVKRVVDPFFTTKEEGKGTGLGLSMVYGFAKQSGGAVSIYSELGLGTTVRLYFPAADGSADPSLAVKVRIADKGGSERILVVDDRVDVAELACMMLQEYGYRVETAPTGAKALEALASGEPFDLLFSDLIMPGGMNGVALAREALRRQPELKVLLTTGYADAALERTDLSGSKFETIGKPYQQGELVRRVRAILHGQDATGQ